MAQTRRHSMIETCSNTFIGLVGSWMITYLVLLYVDDKALATTTAVVLCTIWSLIRGYAVRRHFSSREQEDG